MSTIFNKFLNYPIPWFPPETGFIVPTLQG